MPALGERTPRPVLLSLGQHADFDRLTSQRGATWWERWMETVLGRDVLLPTTICEPLYHAAIDVAEAVGLCVRTASSRGDAIALAPGALDLHTQTRSLQATGGRRTLTVPAEVAPRLLGMPCLDAPQDAYDETSRALDALARRDTSRFPFTFLDHVLTNEPGLLQAFLDLLGTDLDAQTQQRLRDFMRGTDEVDSLRVRLSKVLEELLKERQAYQQRALQLRKQLDALKAKGGPRLRAQYGPGITAHVDERACWRDGPAVASQSRAAGVLAPCYRPVIAAAEKAAADTEDPAMDQPRKNAIWATFLMVAPPGSPAAAQAEVRMHDVWPRLPGWAQDVSEPHAVACSRDSVAPAMYCHWPRAFVHGIAPDLYPPGVLVLNDMETADEATRHLRWRRWLHLYNTFQTLTGVLLATTEGLQHHDYDTITPAVATAAGTQPTDATSQAWASVLDTTDEIRRQAVALLEGVAVDDLDDGTDDNSRYKSLSHGPAPIMEFCASREALVERVKAILAAWGLVPEALHLGATCVMAESKAARDQLMAALRAAGYAVESIEPDTHVSAAANGLLNSSTWP